MVSRTELPTAMPKPSLTCLKLSMSMHEDGRAARSASARARWIAVASRSRKSWRLGRPVRLSCTASCSSRSSASLAVGDVGERAGRSASPRRRSRRSGGHAAEPVVSARRRRACGSPALMPPATLLDHGVERGAEQVAVAGWMTSSQLRAGPSSDAALKPELLPRSRGRSRCRSRGTSQSQTESSGADQRQRLALGSR